ncbi:MAG: two-component sensor histidine kinase [Bacteroidetes bacterium HGW-Bacteroidetes-1]|jgi:two-component system phosphate regulon sensor histidine kinase PhoR|nr:MAG: two-component sensor histidine kinase [Bacteroidetes bacterium HGW-Bacteroidetes-1]
MTQYRETNKVALTVALLVVAILTILLLLLLFLTEGMLLWHIIVIDILIFISCFLIYQYAVEKFINKKIKLIFRTIPRLRAGKAQKEKFLRNDSIEGINEAVIEWGAKQSLEIEELKKMAVYRREFLGNISHELKTPIFNIQGYILTLIDGGLDDPNINVDYLVRTEKSINRLIAIVEDLEEISKLESGEVKLNLVHFDLVELTKDVIEFLEMKATRNNALVSIDNKIMRSVIVRADKKRIRQVLINLIENAIKYSDKEENKILVRFFDMDENYLIEIKDNGPGIPQESLPRIFERFYRTDKGRSRDMGGTGLGLAIVKHIIEAHDQTISVRSKFGQGTIFSFTLSKTSSI